MRSLFIKIFLWFWVAMALVSVASFLSAVVTESHPFFAIPWLARLIVRPPTRGHLEIKPGSYDRWSSVAGNSLRLSGQTAVEIYEHEGKPLFLHYVSELERVVRIDFFLYDDHNVKLTPGPAPVQVTTLSLHHSKEGLDFRRTENAIFLAQQLPGPSGKNYTLITRIPIRHFLLGNFRFWTTNLFIIFITAGGVCYWLARYISTPISKLGAAARNLADGDLKVRVGSVWGRRRDEIGELGRDFDQMAERLESLIGSQKRLLRDISHEFRSPLARLTVALEIARRGERRETTHALDRIGLEAERLNGLIGKLLMLARLESGVEEAEKTPVAMAELVEELAADADFEARGRDCRVEIVSAENGIVVGNRELLRSAVENVLRNAVRHTAEGSEVRVSLGFVQKGGSGFYSVIEVVDKGPGVPESSLADLFSPFYRVGDARDRKRGGTGLGLAITERAVRTHGGRVWAQNGSGGGLIVTIELPAKSAA
ncbi:MAG: ATP-binding protein [Syntrophobacteraceae bacterium]|nr:ATP-binding protein [Syntrophobacteraceae bacterium]